MAEILPKIYRLIGYLSLFLLKNVPYGTFLLIFIAPNKQNVPYGTYQSAGLVSEPIE